MRTRPAMLCCLAVVFLLTISNLWAQNPPDSASTGVLPKVVEISPKTTEAEVGQQLKFTAIAKDASGQVIDQKPSFWFAAPFDLAAAEDGTVTFYLPGKVRVGAVVGGKSGYADVIVHPAHVASIDIAPLVPLTVGGAFVLNAVARTADGTPRSEAVIEWKSESPAIAKVDASGTVLGVAHGKAVLVATSEKATAKVTVQVIHGQMRRLTIDSPAAEARTGDVIHFSVHGEAAGANSAFIWSVNRGEASIYPDGAFVAEQPGTFLIRASNGEAEGVTSILIKPRNAEREIEVVGRVPVKEDQVSEEWIIGNHAYLSSISDKVWSYDISDPANPKLLDTLQVDARLVNDISTTPDGKIGVIPREEASTRKNGIIFLDTSDPAHLKVLSEYTTTVTGGVHSAYINSHYVYITDDATGSLRIIDFADVKNPKEVARWQVDTPLAKTIEGPFGPFSAGRYLHDVQVKDGLAYLAYWRDGLVILDVGNGVKGGSPEKPQLVSQLRTNYHELYGDGWLAGAHAIFRYKNYVFVGDEVFPATFDVTKRDRIAVRGIVHVVDVSDVVHPKEVATYGVPEAGSHNIWVDNDILYMGYYNGGGRVLDVSGELRGDLYRQGREISRLWTGDISGFRTNLPFCWGAQPQDGLIYFNDVNSGLWIAKLGKPRYKGMTTAPGLP
jgi:hypothetical protein